MEKACLIWDLMPVLTPLFFVDEASMISNADGEGNFGSGCLLDDLIQYIYNGRNNRLILIGRCWLSYPL